MRRSSTPLRATSSPSAGNGVDVKGRPKLRSAFLLHTRQEPEFPKPSLGLSVGSTDAQLERATSS